MLDTLWNEYFYEKCAEVSTDEERALIKNAAEARKALNKRLTDEKAEAALERYIEALYKMQDFLAKKAFFKGLEFAVAFLSEAEKN